MFQEMEFLESVASTNDHLHQFLRDAKARIVVAGEQTAGKGRFGRYWESPPGLGLYVSYLFYPSWGMPMVNLLNMISSLSVIRGIEKLGLEGPKSFVKPPNDVFINGKKVCGILTEVGSVGEQINWAIVGIGVNVLQTSFSREISDSATSLVLEGVKINTPMDLLGGVTLSLSQYLEVAGRKSWEEIEGEYISRSL